MFGHILIKKKHIEKRGKVIGDYYSNKPRDCRSKRPTKLKKCITKKNVRL